MAPSRVSCAVACAGAASVLGLHAAFVQPAAPVSSAPAQPRGAAAGSASAPVAGGSALPSAGLVASIAAATACSSVVARRAAAVKKKGVKVVEGKEIPWNLFMPKSPYKGKTLSNETITTRTPLVNWETTHVIMDHDGKVPYIEGQSIGIIAPGPDKKGEVPAKIRLYSIASSACGDDETSKTVSLCVKRVVEVAGRGWCEYSNVEKGKDPEFPDAEKVYRGVCSNHICDLKAGDDVLITGPTGAEMLLPEDQEANIVMLATGTGIAPFRSFLRKLFHDKATKGQYKGLAWLFLGVPFAASILYDDEWKAMRQEFPDNFRFDYAVSDEQKNASGGPMWVQHRAMEYAEQLWRLMKAENTHVYMCGLKGMESGLKECLEECAKADGIEWPEYVKQLKKAKRYHVEVY